MHYVRHEQCLHPERKNYSGAANAISNLSLKLTTTLENKLFVFGTNDAKESIFDMICNQWMAYQNDPLSDESYNLSKDNRPHIDSMPQKSVDYSKKLSEIHLTRKLTTLGQRYTK